jgi:hypothetical protein
VHTGTFLRFHLGYAYMVADYSPYDPMGGSNFGFSIGGTLTRGLALAGLLDFASGGDEEGIFMGQFGLGLSYYFMPVNMYAGLSVGYASGGYDDPSTDVADALEVETDGAFSYTVSVGYEYLFKDSAWGLGPAVRFWQSASTRGASAAPASYCRPPITEPPSRSEVGYDTRVKRRLLLLALALTAACLATGVLGTGCGRTHDGSDTDGSAGSAGSESDHAAAHLDLARAQCAYLQRCDPDALHRFSKSSLAACVDYFSCSLDHGWLPASLRDGEMPLDTCIDSLLSRSCPDTELEPIDRFSYGSFPSDFPWGPRVGGRPAKKYSLRRPTRPS